MKCQNLLCMLLGLSGLFVSTAVQAGLQWQIDARQVQLAEVEIERVTVTTLADAVAAQPSWVFELSDLHHAWAGPIGDLSLRCTDLHWSQCRTADLQWQPDQGERKSGQLNLNGPAVEIEFAEMTAVLSFAPDVPQLKVAQLPVEWLISDSPLFEELTGFSATIDTEVLLSDSEWPFSGRIEGLSFDSVDGQVAAAELGISFDGHWQPLERDVDLALSWDQGEALFGPLYLPPPDVPITLEVETALPPADQPLIAQLALTQADQLELEAQLTLLSTSTIGLDYLDANIHQLYMQLAPIWAQGLESLAESLGLAGFQPNGALRGQLQVEQRRIQSALLELEGVDINDQRERVAVEGLMGQLEFDAESNGLNLHLNWQDAMLMRLDLGASELGLSSNGAGRIELASPPFRLPLLDGHLVVHELQWDDWLSNQPRFVLNAELEPIQLAKVSQAFGWPDLGGELSGYLPGMRYDQGVLQFDGGMSASVFSGALQVSNLEIERPFGPLPALAADIEFSQLDLFELTGAFDFGSMQGRLNGYMRDLRLLDWQPVAFDAWLATDAETSDKRRISQQAVDSISSLSGAGGAVLSNTVLRVFDDFPYANVGLGCSLSEGVCQMRGLNEMDNGGYLIVEGRGLPHLDIIGYQRRVNWDRLLSQILSATQGGVSIGQADAN